MMRSLAPVLALMATLLASQTAPAQVAFGGWSEQRFSMFGGNDWRQSNAGVSVTSDGAVSMLWTALPEALAEARSARWSWRGARSVPPTALSRNAPRFSEPFCTVNTERSFSSGNR